MKKRSIYIWGVRVLMWVAAGITAALTLFLLGYVLIKGIPNISWELLSTKPSILSLSCPLSHWGGGSVRSGE